MATTSANRPPSVVIDANVMIALRAKEADKYAVADAELTRMAQAGYQFSAPRVIIAECLFVLCKKQQDGILSDADHASAVADLGTYLGMVLPAPNGDRTLVARAEQIRSGCGCSRSADGLYLALAEELTAIGTPENATFDAGLRNQARANAPSVNVILLTPSTPPASTSATASTP
jgi:predicted nucleic acid-binding protein